MKPESKGHSWERGVFAASWRCSRCGSVINQAAKPLPGCSAFVSGAVQRFSCEEVMIHQVMKT